MWHGEKTPNKILNSWNWDENPRLTRTWRIEQHKKRTLKTPWSLLEHMHLRKISDVIKKCIFADLGFFFLLNIFILRLIKFLACSYNSFISIILSYIVYHLHHLFSLLLIHYLEFCCFPKECNILGCFNPI